MHLSSKTGFRNLKDTLFQSVSRLGQRFYLQEIHIDTSTGRCYPKEDVGGVCCLLGRYFALSQNSFSLFKTKIPTLSPLACICQVYMFRIQWALPGLTSALSQLPHILQQALPATCENLRFHLQTLKSFPSVSLFLFTFSITQEFVSPSNTT